MNDSMSARGAGGHLGRRRLLKLAATVGGAALVPAGATRFTAAQGTPIVPSDAYDGEQFVIYSYGGSWDEAVQAGAVNYLQQKYPGLEIIIDPSGGFTKLLAERESPSADVSFIDDSSMPQAIALEIAQPLELNKIPSAANIYPQGKLFDNYGLAVEFGRLGIAYRTDKVPSPPASWSALWDPAYQGHVAIGAPSPGGTAWLQFLVAAARLSGGDVDNIDPGFDKLAELKPGLLTITETTAQVTELLVSGDLWLTHFWDGRTIALARDGVPVAFAAPEEGAFATITYISMIKGTALPDLAHEFIELMLSQQGQVAFGQYIGYGPTNMTIQLPEPLIAEGVLYGQDQVEAMQILDWEALAPIKAEWLERWNAAMR